MGEWGIGVGEGAAEVGVEAGVRGGLLLVEDGADS